MLSYAVYRQVYLSKVPIWWFERIALRILMPLDPGAKKGESKAKALRLLKD